MRYKKLRITNYRGVGSSEIAFESNGVTLIQGPNEAGKTSLGEAIAILFEYPDSSKHKDVVAIRPVHRDAGPEIELEAESGPYHFTYTKTFHKKPQTTLTVISPSPANYTGRDAHDRAQQILAETLDVNLWRALTIQQGVAIEQPDLANQQSLSAALDRAAGGVPTDQAEEGLFAKVSDEFGRFFTAKGQEKGELKQARSSGEQAESAVAEIEEKLRSLDQDAEAAARLQAELVQLKSRETSLTKELGDYSTSVREIETLEGRVNEAKLKMESAANSLKHAKKAKEDRDQLIKAVEDAKREHGELAKASQEWISGVEKAEAGLKSAERTLQQTDTKRRDADAQADLRRADFDYYNNVLFLEQLGERKTRIDAARKVAAQAAELLARNKVNNKALKAVEEAERSLMTASARLETAAPSVRMTGLGRCDLQVDDVDTSIEPGAIREFSVADRLRIVIPNTVDVEIAAGTSIDQLTRQVSEAQSAVHTACRNAGVSNPDAARAAFESYQQAKRRIEEQGTVEEENLRDLTYDELTERLVRLEQNVPSYLANRPEVPTIAADLESAKVAWDDSVTAQQEAQAEWDSARLAVDAARQLREQIVSENETNRIGLRSLETDLQRQTSRLESARKADSDSSLESTLTQTQALVASEEANVNTMQALLDAENPERIRTLADTTASSLATCKNRREAAQMELTQVETRLKLRGEEGLYEKLQAAKTKLERVASENRSLFRRAAAAKLLHDIMRRERDDARRAYLAPLKERIERLGRLVFEDAFQVELDDNLRIVSRTHHGVTVPFDSLSGGTKEQLSLIFRLACSMIVAEQGGMPLIMDDALGYTDPERLRLMGAVLARAARECQIVVFTCVPERYANIGNAVIVSL